MTNSIINRPVGRYRATVAAMDINGAMREQFEYGETPQEAFKALQKHVSECLECSLEICTIMVRATYEDEYVDMAKGHEKNGFVLKRKIRDSAAAWHMRRKPDDLVADFGKVTPQSIEHVRYTHATCSKTYKQIAGGARTAGKTKKPNDLPQ